MRSLLPKALTAAAVLGLCTAGAQAATVAYWQFEEGPAGTDVPGPGTPAGAYGGTLLDSSGNGNHLTVYNTGGGTGYGYRADTPTTPFANTLSVQNTGGFPSMYTHSTGAAPSGIDVEQQYTAFTVEAFWKPENGGFRTVVGRDSVGEANASFDQNLASFYLGANPNGAALVRYIDADGFVHEAVSADGAIVGFDFPSDPTGSTGTWYHLAATMDGSDLNLYIDGVLAASTDLLASGTGNTATVVATAAGPNRPNAWSVGRGMYAGGDADRAYGFIDEVRISDMALSTNEFLINVPEPGSLALLGLGGLMIARRRRG